MQLFTCGPSVYRRQHIGNYRAFLFEDAQQRYLENRGYRGERAINFTDVEDKVIEEAKERGLRRGVWSRYVEVAEASLSLLLGNPPRSGGRAVSACLSTGGGRVPLRRPAA
ncbi:MAG: hypothetical protein ACLFRR_05350 [Spirochaetaceae bacterium]